MSRNQNCRLLVYDYKVGYGGQRRGMSQSAPGRDAGSVPDSEIRPTTLRHGQRPDPSRQSRLWSRDTETRDATAK